MIQWSEAFATGDTKVDEQHKILFAKFNELSEKSAAGHSPEVLEGMVSFLGVYARTHFTYEELCMKRHKCPAAQSNEEAHRKFLATFQSFNERLKKEGPSLALMKDLQTTGENWLRSHIMKVDTQLRPCMKQ